jgi:hypothetical protein
MVKKAPPARRAKARIRRAGDQSQLSLFGALEPCAPTPSSMAKPRRRGKAAAKPPAPAAAPFLTPRDAAVYLGVSVSTLKAWRAKKIGPVWRRRGARLVYYRPADLDRFLEDGAAAR